MLLVILFFSPSPSFPLLPSPLIPSLSTHSYIVVNLTEQGIALADIYTAAIDEIDGSYFMVYNKSNTLQLAVFALEDPT
jgi:hypothetical protein